MITTTLNHIRAASPCTEGWETLLRGLNKSKADDESLPLSKILEINGLFDTLWCCQVLPQHAALWRSFSVRCARRAEHLMVDPRTIHAVNVGDKYVHGKATYADLREAFTASMDATKGASDSAAFAAFAAVGCVAWDVYPNPSYDAAGHAVRGVALDAARAIARDVAATASSISVATNGIATWSAAWDDAWNNAIAAEHAVQAQEFLKIVS